MYRSIDTEWLHESHFNKQRKGQTILMLTNLINYLIISKDIAEDNGKTHAVICVDGNHAKLLRDTFVRLIEDLEDKDLTIKTMRPRQVILNENNFLIDFMGNDNPEKIKGLSLR